MLKIRYIVICGILLSSPTLVSGNDATTQKDTKSCFGDLGAVLSAGGYSGSLDCDSVKVEIIKVGTIDIAPNAYTVYDLHYRTIPAASMAAHGGQKIIIVLNSKTYLGQYVLSPPPLRKVTIEGTNIVIDISSKSGNKITIGKDGPPSSVYLDDDDADLSK